MSLFSVHEKADAVLVKSPAKLDAAASHELLELVKGWVRKPAKVYILDFTTVDEIDQIAYRPLMLMQQALKKSGAYIATLNLSPKMAQVVTAAGLDSVLSPKKNLDEALTAAGMKAAPQKLTQSDMELIDPFIRAIKTTFEIQANTPVKIGQIRAKNLDETHDCDIAAVVSLASKKYNGSIAICFPSPVFLQIYSNMLGEKHEIITRETEDCAGEILNMIFGVAKAELNDKGGWDIQRAIPAIVRGQSLRVHHLSRGVAMIVPVEITGGKFHVEMSMEPA